MRTGAARPHALTVTLGLSSLEPRTSNVKQEVLGRTKRLFSLDKTDRIQRVEVMERDKGAGRSIFFFLQNMVNKVKNQNCAGN
jgi:hypothetical protein